MSSITAPAYDPTSTATAMAQKSTAAAQQILTGQTSTASATAKALASLSSAISAFQTSLSSLTGLGKTMLAQTATLSNTSVGTATAKPTAAAGSYNVFVKQIATAGQVAYNIGANAPFGGQLTVSLAPPAPPPAPPATPPAAPSPVSPPTASFTVNLDAAADTDKDGNLSAREIAAAINSEPTNAGQVSAGVVTLNGIPQLVLTSKNTGVANNVWLDQSAVTDPTLAGSLGLDKRIVNAQAQDAIVQFGASSSTTGTAVTQASNTFTNIDGVSMTFTHAQAATDNPITLQVAGDSSGTASNVQAFVDAYNKLKTTIDAMIAPGNSANNQAAGAFAHDAGIKALQGSLVSMLRSTGTSSLASYGIIGTRDGTLSVDSARLNKQLSVSPTGLDALIGSASTTSPSGVAGSLNTYLNVWSNSTNGQLKQRADATTKLQSTLTQRQSDLDAQYNSAYDRYLKQFTELQTLQSSMNSNVSMFDALFGSDKSN
jgi:flagellar hook-associated protein 2